MLRNHRRRLQLERLETRRLLAAAPAPWQNAQWPEDVDHSASVEPRDALLVINGLNRMGAGPLAGAPAEGEPSVDVTGDGHLAALDALRVINDIHRQWNAQQQDASAVVAGAHPATIPPFEARAENLIEPEEVQRLLDRASRMSTSNDAIIAIVDRTGKILGVRVEDGVDPSIRLHDAKLAFAVDGAVAKARTAAFFSSNAAPLPSRTVRFISQSTVTQREVESSPNHPDPDSPYRGPGFVAPIGVGGHFPAAVAFTPQVDLFGIEHQSRDSQLHPGFDGIKGTADDFRIQTRFNVDPAHIPQAAKDYMTAGGVGGADPLQVMKSGFPESWGLQSGVYEDAQGRGIATLPGGVPLFKLVTDDNGNVLDRPSGTLPQTNLVGGIGVFFPGPHGYATFEQGFVHTQHNGGRTQSEFERNNAPRVLEAEFIAFATAANNQLVGPFARDLGEFENPGLPRLSDYVLPTGRIDLVGITLEIFGPTPTRAHPVDGITRLVQVGQTNGGGRGASSGSDLPVTPEPRAVQYLPGDYVPEGWLVAPHDSPHKGGLTAAQVEQIIQTGVDEANRVRAAIRLDLDNHFKPGERTRMVLAVADTDGEVLGLYRMPDATVFSIDVSVAKARNTGYYADRHDLQDADRIDFNGDGTFGPVAQSLDAIGDTVPLGTALTNRTIRFLSEPRYPTGNELPPHAGQGMVNDPNLRLRDQQPSTAREVGVFSILQDPGIHPRTAENLDANRPLSASVYMGLQSSVLGFDAFMVSRNFRDPGDATVGNQPHERLANQNGIVFFPGSSPLYVDNRTHLAGGFGVSGDGVDQDDVVTAAGQSGFDPQAAKRADQYVVGEVRLPFQNFNRHPRGA